MSTKSGAAPLVPKFGLRTSDPDIEIKQPEVDDTVESVRNQV